MESNSLNRWNFIQCYYVLKSDLRNFYNLDNSEYRKKLSNESNPIYKLLWMIAIDDVSQGTLIHSWYKRNSEDLENIRKKFKDDEDILKYMHKLHYDLIEKFRRVQNDRE